LANTYTNWVRFAIPAEGDADWGDTLRDNLINRLEATESIRGLCVTPAEMPSTSLNLQIAHGRFQRPDGTVVQFNGATIAAPAGDNYLWLDATGTPQITAGAPDEPFVPLAILRVGGAQADFSDFPVEEDIEDDRVVHRMCLPAAQSALTAANAGAINSGDATTDAVIGNMRTRINELESRLQALELIP
jgi:hypothetical protein